MPASTLGALARTMAFVGSSEHGVEWEHNTSWQSLFEMNISIDLVSEPNLEKKGLSVVLNEWIFTCARIMCVLSAWSGSVISA